MEAMRRALSRAATMRVPARSPLWLVLLVLIGGQGCAQSGSALPLDTFARFRTQPIELRDSLYILNTVDSLSRIGWNRFENYSRMYEVNMDDVQYFVPSVFYSPDKRKMVAWVGDKVANGKTRERYSDKEELNRICPTGGDTVYSMSALIGYRSNTDSLWHLSPLDMENVGCSPSMDRVLNIMGQYYFEQMKTHAMYGVVQSGPEKGDLKLNQFAYNLQDPKFWTDCWIWQKDTVGSDGLYWFEVKQYRGYQKFFKSAIPWDMPSISYPKEILDMYPAASCP